MSAVNFLKTNNSITLHYEGKTKLVANGDPNFALVLNAIRENRLDDIPAIVEPERYLTAQGFDVEDGLVSIGGEPMPSELNARILAYKQDGLPYTSLLKFWDNLRQNPSFNSRKALFSFLENQGHSITEDGCFIGYRGVREDFKDKHSGKFDNSPGKKVSVPRSEVDDNPANDCSFGLHVGGFNYAKSFGPKLVMVKVNPKNVVAVPDAYKGEKMRVCEFEVLAETASPLEKPVVSEKGGVAELLLTGTAKGGAPDDTDGQPYFDVNAEIKAGDMYLKSIGKGHVAVKGVGGSVGVREMTPSEKRAHKRRYANNFNKRGPDGKFAKKGKKR
jgi:hypothetical protein